MQAIKVYNSGSLKKWRDQSSGLEGYHKFTVSKDKMHILRVDRDIDSFSFSQIEIFSASDNIRFRF